MKRVSACLFVQFVAQLIFRRLCSRPNIHLMVEVVCHAQISYYRRYHQLCGWDSCRIGLGLT